VQYVEKIMRTLETNEPSFEIVLVANYDKEGNDDTTPVIVRNLCAQNNKCRFVTEEKQGMMGWDLRTGLTRANGNFILFLDGDGQTPVEEILRAYGSLLQSGADICTVYRTHREDGLFRIICSFFLNLLFRLFFPGIGTRDINGKPKIIKRSAYKRMCLTSNDWFADAEFMLEARRLKMQVCEIPGMFLKNTWRKSFIGLPAIAEFGLNLVKYRFRYWFYGRLNG